MQFEQLITEHLYLRKLTPEILSFVHHQYEDDTLMKFLGLETTEQLQQEKEKFRKGLSTYNRSFCYFQLIDKLTVKIIGGCGYHTWYTDHQRAEIGYWLTDDAFKGKGIMTEAMVAVLDYGFNKMGLHRVEAFIGPDNIASLKLAAKFNFIKEGQLREHYNKNGVMEDSVVFSLLKNEYKK